MDLAQIFEQIKKKRVVLPRATQRARQASAIKEDEELAVMIQAVAPSEYVALGDIPTWMFDPNEMASTSKGERATKDKRSVEWLNGLFSIGITDPPFVGGTPDRTKGEIGLGDLMGDREVLISAILEWSALFTVRDGDGGPFRADTEEPAGDPAVPGGADLRSETLGAGEQPQG